MDTGKDQHIEEENSGLQRRRIFCSVCGWWAVDGAHWEIVASCATVGDDKRRGWKDAVGSTEVAAEGKTDTRDVKGDLDDAMRGVVSAGCDRGATPRKKRSYWKYK